jgi:hypothetical protein
MKRWLLALAACSGSQNPYEVVPCQGYLTQTGSAFVGSCDLPCQKAGSNGGAPSGTGPECTGLHGSGDMPPAVMCGFSLKFDDHSGCCASGTDGMADVEWYQCI